MSGGELLAPGLELDALVRLIAGLATVRDHGDTHVELRLLDSADRRLRSQGLDAFHDGRRLRLVQRADGRERREDAAALVTPRALLEQAGLHGRQRRLDVLDQEGKTVVRVELSDLRVQDGAADPLLGPRARLAGLRGYEPELDVLQQRLCGELGFAVAREPLADAAVRALGGDPHGVQSKVQVPLTRGTRADAAAVAVLRALEGVIEANLQGTIDDLDDEFLHDLRVSVRRSRAVQRQLKAIFPPAELERHRAAFRWIQQVTGELRDLDVQLYELDGLRESVGEDFAPDLEPLSLLIAERRSRVQREVADALGSRHTEAILRDWSGLLEELVELPTDDRPQALEPIEVVAGARIAKLHRRMVHDGRRIGTDSPDEDLHDLRKRGKELRYMLELFGAELFDPEVVDPLVKTLKALQDVLGRHQDRHVQNERLRAMTRELADRPGGPEALVAVGVALRVLREDAHAAREEFAERFAAFSAGGVRRAVRETFAP